MHALFVHHNYPAQFGQIAAALVRRRGYRATFVTRRQGPGTQDIERIYYTPTSGATARSNYHSRTFENAVGHAEGVYRALAARPDIRPDLVVGHSGFGSTLFLPELYDCPVISYFEYFYRSRDSDMDFRPEYPPRDEDRLRAHARSAMILLDLNACAAGYTPTAWQRDRMPAEYRSKLRTIFDGIDTSIWRRTPVPRMIGDRLIPQGTRIVTYVSRGLEIMRGFDIFMKVAKRIAEARSDVMFVCVGDDRHYYGDDARFTGGRSFREHVLANGDYPLDRFAFTGRVRPGELVRILSLSDLHVYLTVPFIASWSLLNAMACECVVLGSDTGPVREFIAHGRTGLLAEFYDVDRLAALAQEVLADPGAHRPLAQAAARLVRERYSLDVTVPRMEAFYEQVVAAARGERGGADPSPGR